jgi:dipeptidase E
MMEIGINVEDIDIFGKTETDLYKILKDKDVIYVQGGDPYYLLKHIKKSGFDKVVKEYINLGKIYIGVSAGTYMACPTIEMALWRKPNRPKHGLADNEACMNLVPFLITPHYESKYHDAVKHGIENTIYPVRILNDNQALLVKNNSVQLVGDKNEIIL